MKSETLKLIGKRLATTRKSCLLVLSCCFCLPVFAESNPPSEPQSLQGVRYSPTAGEIFWSSAVDESTIVGYRVYRDGTELGVRDARSVFEPTLQPGVAYRYQVSAIDSFGNEGPARLVDISAINGEQTSSSIAGAVEPVDEDLPTETLAQDGTELVLYSASGRATLQEGDANGVSIAVSLERRGEQRAVELSLEAVGDRDALNLRHEFSSTTLNADESGSVLTLRLDISVAPLLVHERNFRIIASDGVSRTTVPLTIDVAPSSAPDVYLLIGQSNMEGYSELGSRQAYEGGLDERNERIKQLNVQPNSRSIFFDDNLFRDEQQNISTPTFVPAEDPLHEPRFIGIDGKEATFVGLGLTFAKSALGSTTADIYLVPAAWGATGFCANANGELAWNASATPDESYLGGTLLADRALTRLNMTLRETGGILRGILWHQGGADSNNPDCASSYADNLSQLAARLRQEARQDGRGSQARGSEANIPFIVATQSRGDDERGEFSTFNSSKVQVDAAQRSVSQYIAHADFVNNDDLVPPQYACGQTSCVHFGAQALREQGRRYYAAMKRVWNVSGAFHY